MTAPSACCATSPSSSRHSRWAEDVQILLAGFPDGEIDDLVALNPERLQAAGSVPDAVAELWCRLGEADQAAEEPDGTYRTVLHGRLHDRPGDQWLPILLLAAEPDPADLPALAGVCDELAGRGRSTAAVVTAAVVTPDPLPGTELVVDDHGQLHGEQLTGSTGTTAPGGQLVAAHATAAAAAALVAVLHPSRQPAQPVPALTHPARWAQNMNVDGSLRTGSDPDPSPDLSVDDPDDTTPPPVAPDGPDTPDLSRPEHQRAEPDRPGLHRAGRPRPARHPVCGRRAGILGSPGRAFRDGEALQRREALSRPTPGWTPRRTDRPATAAVPSPWPGRRPRPGSSTTTASLTAPQPASTSSRSPSQIRRDPGSRCCLRPTRTPSSGSRWSVCRTRTSTTTSPAGTTRTPRRWRR